jgi:hypothetical protein
MIDLLLVTLPILIVDVANPVLLAAVVFGLASNKPIATSLAVIAGHSCAYFLAGTLIIFGLANLLAIWLAPLIDWFNDPAPADYIVGFVLGVLLIVVSWRWKIAPPTPSDNQANIVSGGLIRAFSTGAVLNFVGIPFALPYFAFINELYKLQIENKFPALLLYNMAYAVPFLLAPFALAILGQTFMPTLFRINQGIEKCSAYIFPAIIGLLGLVAVVDAIVFFHTGTGLI